MNKVDRPFVNLLGLINVVLRFTNARARRGERQATLEQVNQAVRETQRLCEDQIDKIAVPGLAIAVVFQG